MRSILEGREHQALAVDPSPSDADDSNLAALAMALANLAALGYPVHLRQWDEGYQVPASVPATSRKRLTVKVCGAHPAPMGANDHHVDRKAGHDAGPPKAARVDLTSLSGQEHRTSPPPEPTKRFQDGHHAGKYVLLERTMNPPEPENHAGGNGRTASLNTSSRQVPPTAASEPAAAPPAIPATSRGDLVQAIRQTHESLVALQRLAEQTAQLHHQFLEGQAATQQSFQSLLDHQQRLTSAILGQSGVRAASATRDRFSQPRHSNACTYTYTGAQGREPVARASQWLGGPLGCIFDNDCFHPASGQGAPGSGGREDWIPLEMLELDMQLDDDLGIDSIKRVEILSALQDRLPDAPAVKPDQLGTLRTLRQIAEFLAPGPAIPEIVPQGPAGSLHAGRNGDTHVATAPPLAAVPTQHVTEVLLQVVAEKTGYPVEMLELDMQLDDDLGIDSIKRVEILSALQDRLPDAPAVKPDQLGTLRTLRQIAEFLAPGPAIPEIVPQGPAGSLHAGRNGDTHVASAAPLAAVPAQPVTEVLLRVVAEKTGYPVEMLELDMQLDDDLGIDSIKRVEILSALQDRLPEAPAVKPEHLGSLRTLGQIADFLARQPAGPQTDASPSPARQPAPSVPTSSALQCLVPQVIPPGCSRIPGKPQRSRPQARSGWSATARRSPTRFAGV